MWLVSAPARALGVALYIGSGPIGVVAATVTEVGMRFPKMGTWPLWPQAPCRPVGSIRPVLGCSADFWVSGGGSAVPFTHQGISDPVLWLTGEGVPLSPAKLNGSDSSKSLPSPSSSPQPDWIASPTHDPQWCPSDPTDSSLSSLFGECLEGAAGHGWALRSTPGWGLESEVPVELLVSGFIPRHLHCWGEVAPRRLACTS